MAKNLKNKQTKNHDGQATHTSAEQYASFSLKRLEFVFWTVQAIKSAKTENATSTLLVCGSQFCICCICK